MTPASRLPVKPGEKVLDCCAAPGGKATALGAKLMGQGLLVANDINAARGKALLRNLELFGLSNILVANEPPYKLVDRFPEYFDKIMVDAPCSGEGMFRKNPSAIENWLEKGPDYFARLQFEIVQAAAKMLKPGGMMFYSTCTFSPLENEGTIAKLLEACPDMRIIPMEDYEGFSHGFTGQELKRLEDIYPELAEVPAELAMTRRIWPHRMNGEGHYLALLQKTDRYGELPVEEDMVKCPDNQKKDALLLRNDDIGVKKEYSHSKKEKKRKKREAASAYTKEQKEAFMEFFSHMSNPIEEDCLEVRGDKVYYLARELSSPAMKERLYGIHFLRNGIYLGDLKKNRFEPSQPLALSLSHLNYKRMIDLKESDPRLDAYQKGESLDLSDLVARKAEEGQPMDNGWYLVCTEGYGLGFGKLAGTILKNKYPSGWRVFDR